MTDLSVTYMGLKLKSPIVVGSSNLSNSIANIKKIEDAGAGAVVLKSIFEEEIYNEYEDVLKRNPSEYGESDEYLDYFDFKIKEDNIKKYIALIEEAKKKVNIPIIASINCVSNHEWIYFAKKIQGAGADALELNIFIMPLNFEKTSSEVEKIYFDVATKIKQELTIPVSLKISYYFSNLADTVMKLSNTGIDGIVLFNRFFSPDFDIDNFKVVPTNVLSNPTDLHLALCCVSILSGRTNCDLIASTGIHDGEAVIKQLLAGAQAIQVVSVLYKKGIGYVATMLDEVKAWMEKHNFASIDDFRGKMSQSTSENPAIYERVQFMKYFGGKEYDLD
ncbi:MAG: diguanylate cyclase [Candidatus Zixiibacteriota bacterium]|nr:MAG: diguanylate cyclase [candidate division Zixibacteria bacterium]